jgi:hypothetical protein
MMIGFQENLCSRYSFFYGPELQPRVGLKLHEKVGNNYLLMQ